MFMNPLSVACALSNNYTFDMQDLAKRILPLCENYVVVSQFAEARSHFKHGLVNHAFASALRAILQVIIQIILCIWY